MDLEAIREFLIYAGRSRYLEAAGLSWAVYDWMITLGQEIDLVWTRPGAWASKLLFGFTRYYGLTFLAYNMVVASGSGWSRDFCHTYLWIFGLTGTIHRFAVQGALLMRVYVMYHASSKILILNGTVFLCEIVSLLTLLTIDVQHYKTTPGPFGCWSSSLKPTIGTAVWWITLSFETYLCALVIPPAYTYWKSSKRTVGAKILRILIRDSVIWYISSASFMLINALAWTFRTPRVMVFSVPMITFVSTVGGGRLLLSIRALAASNRNPSSTAVARPGDPNYFNTEGTVGGFWSVDAGRRKNDDEDCAASISMGIWSNEDVQQNRPPSPTPVIMLKAVPPARRRCLRPPSSSMVSTNGEEAMASSSGLSSPGPEGEREALQRQRNEPSASEPPAPQASSSTTAGSVRRTQDTDVELGRPKAVT